MNPDFIGQVAEKIKTGRLDMVEKDILIHQILADLSNERLFSTNFLFKGGTCLIKYHIGYLRFSEDIDFTWKNQYRFDGKSSGKTRHELSALINDAGRILEGIAEKRGLDFKCVKSNKRYVELGGSNRMCTFKVWYHSEIQKKETYIKVQINFVEEICANPEVGRLHSAVRENDERLSALFPEYAEYSRPIKFPVYGVREILSEKVRALLTRQGIKARDFLDIYFIRKNLDIKVEDVEKCVIRKMTHSLKLYAKYRENYKTKRKLIGQGEIFEWGTEKGLVIAGIDEKEFNNSVKGLTGYLQGLVKKIDEEI